MTLTRERIETLRLCGSSTTAEHNALCTLAIKGLDAGEGKPVAVKPLGWSKKGWPKIAETPFGKYRVWAGKDVWFGDEWLRGVHAPSDEVALRWAQADYEARIRSALSQAPAPEGPGTNMQKVHNAEGWVLVPVEATPEMCEAAYHPSVDGPGSMYSAMLAARPTHPKEG